MKQILPICLFLLLMTGCKERPEVSATLDRAEALMESAPDSALTLLQTLDTEKFRKRNTHARHALLFTQAQDKNYIDETNDSLISIAVDYYRQHGDVRPRFLSLYYKGRVQTNASDHLNAMLSYAEAEELVDELNDDYYAGLLYSQMGDIYEIYYDFPKGLEAYQKAEECYRKARKIQHYLYALLDCSDIYYNMGEYYKCDSIYSFVQQEAVNLKDSVLFDILLRDKIMLSIETNQMEEGEKLLEELFSANGIESKGPHFLSRVVELFLSKKDLEEASCFMKDSWSRARTPADSVDCYITSSSLQKAKGNYREALQDYESGMILQSKEMRKTLQQPILTMQRDFLAKEFELQKYRLSETKILYLCGWMATFIVFCATFAWLHHVLRKKEVEKISMRLAYEDLKQTLSCNKTEMSDLIQELFGVHFKMVDKLGSYYHEGITDEKQLDKEVCKEVKNFIKGYVDGDAYLELESIVNRYNENVMLLLRKEIQLKEERDYRLVCYHLIGLSAHTISFLMKGITPENIYQKRTRLKKTIKNSNAPHRNLFMRILGVSDTK